MIVQRCFQRLRGKTTNIVMVDQRKLPATEVYVTCKTVNDVAKAIKTMVIRGAPAIGVCAAMGLALGAARSKATGTKQFTTEFQRNCDLLAATRPTAVNLFWAIERMKQSFCRRRAGGRVGRSAEGTAAGGRGSDPRRRRRQLPRDRRAWRDAGAGRRAHSHALQRRRAGDRRLRHRAGRGPRRRRGRPQGARHRRRDAARSCRARGSPPGSCSRTASTRP